MIYKYWSEGWLGKYVPKKILNQIQKKLNYPFEIYDDTLSYIHNRFITKPHLVEIRGLKPGYWYEYDYRMLYACFTILEEFVENETTESLESNAKMTRGEESLLDKNDPDYYVLSNLAKRYQKILDLYYWWTIGMPAKAKEIENIEVCGFKKCSYKEYIDKVDKINKENNKKLLELIEIREFLWN